MALNIIIAAQRVTYALTKYYMFISDKFTNGMLLLSHVRLFVTPWTVARQAPVVHGILQARKLEWVAISFSRGF